MKALSGRGTPLRGGWPSGHAAVAFAGWMAVTLMLDDTDHRFLVSSLALIMALLVAQTRIEAGVHSTLEVAAGGAARRARDARRLPGVLGVTDAELLAAADAIAARAYAPYSNFHVGCAVLCRDGRVIEGVNVENAAYPLGVCAERTAFSRAIVEGYRPGDFVVAAITAVPVRRLPAVARRDEGRAGRLPQRRADRRDDDRRAPPGAVRAVTPAAARPADGGDRVWSDRGAFGAARARHGTAFRRYARGVGRRPVAQGSGRQAGHGHGADGARVSRR